MAQTEPPGTINLVQFALQVATALDQSEVKLWPRPSSDPNEPLNWPAWRKAVNFGLATGMTVAAFTLVTIQTVFWQQIAVDLHLTIPQLSNGNSVQLAGLATGCIFFVPFAVKYGRRPVYLVSIVVLAAATWWTARMNTYTEVILTNLFVGLAGAVNETTVQMTISDLFFVHQRARANACYFVAVMIGSFLTPMAAGAQAAAQGWRWSYYALAIAFTILTFVYIFAFEETKYIRPASGSSIRSGSADGAMQSTAEGDASAMDKKDDIETDLTHIPSHTRGEVTTTPNSYAQRMRFLTPTEEPIWRLTMAPLSVISFPHILFTALQFASGICWLVLMLTSTSVIFSAPPYLFTTQGVGNMSLGPLVGNVFGALYGGPISDWSIKRFARRNGGVFEPEMRLWIMMPPTLFMAGGLCMFGVTAGQGMHWIYPSIGGAFFAFGLGSYGDIAFTLVIDTYRDLVAEAFVLVAFFRNAFSIVVPVALTPWMATMGIGYMYVTAGCISLVIGLLHLPLIIWGKRIRIAMAPRYYKVVEKINSH
ncbi:major facilitator superfamily transporter [Apiospora saccharicola]|uniref:Major facilitator superfamily transporter n=1 Tax=Apiospora saccharicola TaxID=335842 RepID=A0ABR1U313_9PEZI